MADFSWCIVYIKYLHIECNKYDLYSVFFVVLCSHLLVSNQYRLCNKISGWQLCQVVQIHQHFGDQFSLWNIGVFVPPDMAVSWRRFYWFLLPQRLQDICVCSVVLVSLLTENFLCFIFDLLWLCVILVCFLFYWFSFFVLAIIDSTAFWTASLLCAFLS